MNAPAMNSRNVQNSSATFEGLLQNSISCFFGEYRKVVPSFTDLLSIFNGLIQDLNDPPLEIVWFYGAVTFYNTNRVGLPPPGKLLVAKDMFKLIKSCSSLCSVVKRLAVIAPVIYLLYRLVFNFSARDPSLREEIKIFVETIVRYIIICCSRYLEEGHHQLDSLGNCMLDLIRVWTMDQIRESHDSDVLASFFPTLHHEFQQEVIVCLGHLAGVVMKETLLLRLYLKISPRNNQEDLQREMLNLAIQTIKGFQNFYFLDMLLKMLLEPIWPVAALSGSENAVLLQKVLYDAIILVGYSFYSGRWAQSSDSRFKKLALVWVLVAERAIQFARATNDQAKAILYLNAFRESEMVAELIKWASTQAGIMDQSAVPDITTPKALIKWLLVLEDQGIKLFDHSISVLYGKALTSMSVVGSGPSELNLHINNLNQNVGLRYEIGVQDQEVSPKTDAGRKRNEALSGPQEPPVKQVKLDLFRGTGGDGFLPFPCDNGLQYGKEVINIDSDDSDNDTEVPNGLKCGNEVIDIDDGDNNTEVLNRLQCGKEVINIDSDDSTDDMEIIK